MIMNQQYKKLLYIFIFTFIISPVASLQSMVFAEADNKNQKEPPPMVKCYQAALVETEEPTVEALKENLSDLDKLYSQRKINKETYEQRRQDILNKIKDLEK